MGIIIRTEKQNDYEEVGKLIELAFKDLPFSHHKQS
jgi:predicted N-acetyltransferase YhbS